MARTIQIPASRISIKDRERREAKFVKYLEQRKADWEVDPVSRSRLLKELGSPRLERIEQAVTFDGAAHAARIHSVHILIAQAVQESVQSWEFA